MDKKEAISLASQKHHAISSENCNFAKINASKPVWWVDPRTNSEASRWFLLYAPGFLYVLEIPRGIINFSNFRKKDEKSVSVEIATADFIDVKSNGTRYNFTKHIIDKIHCAYAGSPAASMGPVRRASSWPKWSLPSENEILLLAKSTMPFVRFLHPDIVELIVADNERRRDTWVKQLKDCGISKEMYLWELSPCAFPGIRRYAGSKEIAQFRGKTKEHRGQPEYALSLDDNDFPKQIWSHVFRGKPFQKFGPDGYSLAHLVDHKAYRNRCDDEFSCESGNDFPKRLFGLYTSVANTVYIPSNFLKPTDFDGTIRMLLQRKAYDLYGAVCNLVPPLMTIKESPSPSWDIDQFDWAEPVGSLSGVEGFLAYRAEVIDGLLEKWKSSVAGS
ncbi:hypothetical protein [Pseudodesulfovibrio pelocollis]|uniref:hypothetical protein n=1 Tax=Pseudodesulfovibrio pelocollis TaxID=3051432 RepID=UPI00255A86FE|nr:hypothetical protein [Pseudodesulfovibrio sp. SB368]